LAVTVSLAYAGAAKKMSINVPFEFYVEDQLLPAGEYNFEMGSGALPTASVVIVRTGEGKGIRFMLTRSEIEKIANKSHLRFNQYDEKRFLSSVSIGNYKANVKMFKLERELRAANKTAQSVTLIAQN
jgi:hypothetical protein